MIRDTVSRKTPRTDDLTKDDICRPEEYIACIDVISDENINNLEKKDNRDSLPPPSPINNQGAAETLDLFYGIFNSEMSVENDLLLFLAQLNSEAAKSVKNKIDEMKQQANLSRMKKGLEAGFIQDPANPKKFTISKEKITSDLMSFLKKNINIKNDKLKYTDSREFTEKESKNLAPLLNDKFINPKWTEQFIKTMENLYPGRTPVWRGNQTVFINKDDLKIDWKSADNFEEDKDNFIFTAEEKDEIFSAINNTITELNGNIALKEEAILQAELNMAVQRFTSTTGLISDAGKKLESLFKKIAEDFPQ